MSRPQPYRWVSMLGCVGMRSMFAAHGLDFDALDMDILIHPKQTTVKREELAELASAAGFKGPDKVDNFLFDTWIQWKEFRCRRLMKLLKGGNPLQEARAEMNPEIRDMLLFAITGHGVENQGGIRRKHAAFLAQCRGESLMAYHPVARKARAKFQAFLRHAASELSLIHISEPTRLALI
eukprot:7071858-Alexandrium_andersonii.AAC.1